MPLVQDRSLNLLTSSPVHYHWAMAVPLWVHTRFVFNIWWMNEWCFRPWFCTCKAIVWCGQPELMRWILCESLKSDELYVYVFIYLFIHLFIYFFTARRMKCHSVIMMLRITTFLARNLPVCQIPQCEGSVTPGRSGGECACMNDLDLRHFTTIDVTVGTITVMTLQHLALMLYDNSYHVIWFIQAVIFNKPDCSPPGLMQKSINVFTSTSLSIHILRSRSRLYWTT